MARPTVAILSTENLIHNVITLKQRAAPSRLIIMVKANAYGHGLRSVAVRLASYADILGVASIDEALALRKMGIKTPIMLAEGVFEAQELVQASAEYLQVVVHEPTQITWLNEHPLPCPLTVWIKVNTGMGRLGFLPEQVPGIYRDLQNNTSIHPRIGVMSHFACSETIDHPLNTSQIQEFQNLLSLLPEVSPVSLCNSGGLLNFPDLHYDYVRPGGLVYGLSPVSGTTGVQLGLKPVMTLQSNLIAINTLPKGSSVGYGGRYTCTQETRLGVLAIGYGDGYPFSARDGTPTLIGGKICPLIGRVSMDMLTVDVSDCPHAKVGDCVTLWGEGLPVETVALYTSEIPYTLVTGVQHRVRYIWT
jgi:alanine racemase